MNGIDIRFIDGDHEDIENFPNMPCIPFKEGDTVELQRKVQNRTDKVWAVNPLRGEYRVIEIRMTMSKLYPFSGSVLDVKTDPIAWVVVEKL